MMRSGKMSLMAAVLLAAMLFLPACQQVGPADRITQNPVMFRSLSPEHQLMVQQGRICKGMSKDAVFLAWGYPGSAPVRGEKNGHQYERWIYVRQRAVPVDTFGVGMGCGHYGWGPSAGGMNVAYVPEPVANVTFEQEKVTEWESRASVTP